MAGEARRDRMEQPYRGGCENRIDPAKVRSDHHPKNLAEGCLKKCIQSVCIGGEALDRPVSTSEIVLSYIARINAYPVLSSQQEAEVVRRWKEGNPQALDLLIGCNLRHVILPARRAAWNWHEKHDYWPALRELIGAGNYGLVLAAERFRPDAGVRFCTAAKFSIKKEIIQQAKSHRSAV